MIRTEMADGIATVLIDRPQRRNAFDPETTRQLADAVEAATGDPSARVIVIKGAADTFSSGRDLKDVVTEGRADILAQDETWVRLFKSLLRSAVPSVAVVRGYAVAGGFTLAMGCDFVLADRAAKFGALEMRNGFPAAVCTPILARLIGPRLGLEYALFGEMIEAETLFRAGLINRLADGPDDLAEVERAFVGRILELAPDAVSLTRETFRAAEAMPLDNALDMGKHLNQLLAAGGWFADVKKRLTEKG